MSYTIFLVSHSHVVSSDSRKFWKIYLYTLIWFLGSMVQEELLPADQNTMQDEEGSGGDPGISPIVDDNSASPSIASRVRI
jgi:hypothetical protein